MDFRLFLIPLVTGLIGWGTNALAIQMLFKPLKRVGGRWIGWQGVLPAHAERMATTCVRLMTSRLLDVKAVFARIDPEQVTGLLRPALEKHGQDIVEDVLSQRFPKLWASIPERLREQARQRLRTEIPSVVMKLMEELRQDLTRYLDVETLVVRSFLRNRALLNELFWNCGRKEFLFLAHSGLLFGTLFGIGQAVVWHFIQPGWFLPVTGLLVGWATNWLALKMIFEPLEVKKLGPFRWQGLFLRRQPEVSEAYGRFFAEKILHPEALINAVLEGPAAERLAEQLQRYVRQAVDHASGPARPVFSLVVGSAEWVETKEHISLRLAMLVPGELDRLHDYTEEALDLENELCSNLQKLSPPEFEQVLRPLFQEDEALLIAVGAGLGGVAGVLQWVLVTLL